MLQLETLMLFALGFAVAALLALVVARALWLYALRLGRLRSLRQAPATHADLRTEINRLRAENAVTTVRLERKAEALSARNAELIARASRDRDRFDLLAAELERHRAHRPDRALEERARAELAALETEARQAIETLEAEIAERDRLIAELRRSLRAREDEISALRVSADRFAADIAARDRRLVELEQGFEPSASTAVQVTPQAPPAAEIPGPAAERLRLQIEDLAELPRQIEEQRDAANTEPETPEGPAMSAADPGEPLAGPHDTLEPAAPLPPQPAQASRRALKPLARQAGGAALATRLGTTRRDRPPS